MYCVSTMKMVIIHIGVLDCPDIKLQHDQTFPFSVKGVACEIILICSYRHWNRLG